MDLTRRSFIAAMAAGVASMTLDPERALWVPGQKTFFIPDAPKVVTAETMDDALFLGLIGVFPNGRMVRVTGGNLDAERRHIVEMGGKVVPWGRTAVQRAISHEMAQGLALDIDDNRSIFTG